MRERRLTLALGLMTALAPLAAAAQPAAGPTEEVDEVVVTGSRIARQDYRSNTPIVTIGTETLEKTGTVTLDTALKLQPQFVASTGSTTNSSGNQGQANIQLRGLGRQRTLVLMDGRRLPPANSDGSPDINSVPTALIQNIEVITGGASAVYGSDAISGVVNIKMQHQFDGLEVRAQYGISDQGDADDYKVSLAGGGAFADDRGSAVFSLEYANRRKIFLSDRDWTFGSQRDSVLPFGLVTLGSNPPPQAAIDQVFARYGVAPGTVRSGNQFGFNLDGTLFSTGQTVQNYKGPTDPTLYTITGAQVLAEGRQFRFLQLPLERYSFFGRFDFALTPSVNTFSQFMYTHSVAATQLNPVPSGSSAATGCPRSRSPIPSSRPTFGPCWPRVRIRVRRSRSPNRWPCSARVCRRVATAPSRSSWAWTARCRFPTGSGTPRPPTARTRSWWSGPTGRAARRWRPSSMHPTAARRSARAASTPSATGPLRRPARPSSTSA
jgi:iron complex outermembrane receptor protein